MGGFTSITRGLILLVIASMLAVSSTANKEWQYPFNYSTGWAPFPHPNYKQGPSKIIVGGSEHWHFGFNYTNWALKNGPFYLNDTLVFKYDPPSNSSTSHPHSVYLLPNLRSFLTCDLSRATRLANVTQGGGANGFEFVLKKWKPYYFACGESNGIHCNVGLMKFFVMPMFRRFFFFLISREL